jgi:hypothetical protein
MSTKKTLLTVGLSALGVLSGIVALRAQDPRPTITAPAGPSSTVAAPVAPVPMVLLLSDGRVLRGFVSEDAHGYSLKVKGGRLSFRKDQVEKLFHVVEDIYQYKCSRLPARDPDERMKLAHWCLTNHLKAEAKEQLEAVLALSPSSVQAQRMKRFLEDDEDRELFRDSAVVRTGAEVVEEPGDRDLNRVAGREFSGVGLPSIFDLPTPVAVRRAEDFNRSVHPILQAHCAGCHNERYRGTFQLIQLRNLRDQTPTILRANLEATLRLIDPESPARSELLSSALVPHGGAGKGPIFRGPNDPSYQRIALWVKSVCAPRPRDEGASARFGGASSPASDAETFASSRTAQPTSTAPAARVPLPFTPTPAPATAPASAPAPARAQAVPATPSRPDEVIPTPPGQILPGTGTGMKPYAPPDTEFPVPFSVGGPRPKLDSPPGPAPGGEPSAGPADPSKPAPKAPSKPIKIDMELLQRTLMNRYSPPQ